MTSDEMKVFIKQVFADTLENPFVKEEVYAKYFSKDYVQYVDGKILDYEHFIAHTKALKQTIMSMKLDFRHILAEGDKVATVHIVRAVKHNGDEIEAQVNAIFQIKNRQIILCDELTYLVKGEKSDKDLGSR